MTYKIKSANRFRLPKTNRAHAPKAKINHAAALSACMRRAAAWAEVDVSDRHVQISAGNTKLGSIMNNSLPPVFTCCNCSGCSDYCYAVKLFNRMGDFSSWVVNYAIYKHAPDRYFNEITAAADTVRFFRWHTSGDIVNAAYLEGMARAARACKHTRFLAFTKCYHIANNYCSAHGGRGAIPDNLIIVFSAAPGVDMPNPYHFPECHINFENKALNTFHGCSGTAHICSGNCSNCIKEKMGCYFMHDGDAVIINQH